MLYSVKTFYGNGKVTNEIISCSPPFSIKPEKDNIKICIVNVHKYNIEQQLPPTLYVSHTDGRKYIMPSNIEVHPDTTINDIIWTKPKLKKEIKQVEGSNGSKYKTIYNPNKNTYTCNCMGFFRARSKGGVCKHIKELMDKNK